MKSRKDLIAGAIVGPISSQLAESGHAPLLGHPYEVQQLVERYQRLYSSRFRRLSGSYRKDRRWLRSITGQRIHYRPALRSLSAAYEHQTRTSWVKERATYIWPV